jgi:hypothetical protein
MAWGSGWGHGLRRAARGSGWGALLARRRCEGPAAFGLALHVQYALGNRGWCIYVCLVRVRGSTEA